MDTIESTTWLTIAIIMGSVLVSGPLIPPIDFASEPTESTDLTGTSEASISIVSPPVGEFRIAEGRFGSGPFLHVPSATVGVDTVSGDPILIYEVAVHELGFNAVEVVFLGGSDVGRDITIEFDRPQIDGDTITEQSYEAAVSIRLRAQSETRVLYRENVTVAVEGSDAD